MCCSTSCSLSASAAGMMRPSLLPQDNGSCSRSGERHLAYFSLSLCLKDSALFLEFDQFIAVGHSHCDASYKHYKL